MLLFQGNLSHILMLTAPYYTFDLISEIILIQTPHLRVL